MVENRFFRFVWRVNGIALMLLLIVVVGFVAYNILKDLLRVSPQAVITNVAEDPKGDEKWTLGSPVDIEGTPFIYIPLESERKDVSLRPSMPGALHSYKEGYYFAPSRNLLFIDRRSRDMKWLFKDNGQLITDIDPLSGRKPYDKDGKIEAILYRVIGKDTNGDKKLTSDDLAAIAVSDPDGARYKELVPAVDEVFGAFLEGGDVLILYQADGTGYASTVSLRDMSVRDTLEMPKVEQAP